MEVETRVKELTQYRPIGRVQHTIGFCISDIKKFRFGGKAGYLKIILNGTFQTCLTAASLAHYHRQNIALGLLPLAAHNVLSPIQGLDIYISMVNISRTTCS